VDLSNVAVMKENFSVNFIKFCACSCLRVLNQFSLLAGQIKLTSVMT
jgi:hypothetical protein